ncbi:MAG: hypothetical protein ACKOGP_08130 [Bacteroidota bacterium]
MQSVKLTASSYCPIAIGLPPLPPATASRYRPITIGLPPLVYPELVEGPPATVTATATDSTPSSET